MHERFESNGTISQAVLAGDVLHVAGQIAVDEAGDLVGPGNAEVQAEQAIENLRRVVEGAGMTMADIVILRCFLTHADHYPAYAAAKRRYFTDAPPAGTAVIVSALLLEGALMEVEAVAIRQTPT